MKLNEVIPYMICVNLAHRSDRRRDAWRRFSEAGLTVDRQPGILKRTVTDPRGFRASARYACSLAKRLAIRRAKLAGAPAVLLFEDDVVLAPDLHEKLDGIELPDDWGIFFLGCKHLSRPEVVGPGLVRVARAADHHAVAVRAEYFDAMIWALAGGGKGCSRIIDYSDVKSSEIQRVVPTYACFPNLAWQLAGFSDNAASRQAFYRRDGAQVSRGPVAGLEEEMRLKFAPVPERSPVDVEPIEQTPCVEEEPSPDEKDSGKGEPVACNGAVEVALRSDADSPSPAPSPPPARGEWPDFWYLEGMPRRFDLAKSFPLRFYINLPRREDRRFEIEYQFGIQGLNLERFPAIDARFVSNARGYEGKPQYACALSHRLAIREAKLRRAPAVMVFEDDAQPHPGFRGLAEALEPPSDWGVIFFGCTHVKEPQVVSPGWVKVASAYAMHAYAVKAEWYDDVLKALRQADANGRRPGCDVALTRLSGKIPMYAYYPNLVWQGSGFSDLRRRERSPFEMNGRQTVHREVLRETNRLMVRMTGGPRRERGGWLRAEEVHPAGLELRQSLEDLFSSRVYLNLESRADRREEALREFGRQALTVERVIATDGRLARRPHGYWTPGAYGCAVSHRRILRLGGQRRGGATLIFEDDVALHPRFREIVEGTNLPDDWDILYFGCGHVEEPVPIGRGLVRIRGAYGTFAYAVRDRVAMSIRKAMRQAGRERGDACDVVLASLAGKLRTYGFYPNIAWQRPGHSDIAGRHATYSYDAVGRQSWSRNHKLMQNLDRRMRMWIEQEAME